MLKPSGTAGERKGGAFQLSTSNATTVVDSLMKLQVEMRSAETDMDVDEPTGPVGVQLKPPEIRPATCEIWHQKWTAIKAHFDRAFLTNDFRYGCSVCDHLVFMRDITKVHIKHVDIILQQFND
jgi:hypothetical protein